MTNPTWMNDAWKAYAPHNVDNKYERDEFVRRCQDTTIALPLILDDPQMAPLPKHNAPTYAMVHFLAHEYRTTPRPEIFEYVLRLRPPEFGVMFAKMVDLYRG